MSFAAFVWAMKLRNVTPLAKLVAVAIADDYDRGDGKDSGRELTYLADFCCVELDEIHGALMELCDNHQVEMSIKGNNVSVALPLAKPAPKFDYSREKTICHLYVIAANTRIKIGIAQDLKARLDSLRGWAPEDLQVKWTAKGPRGLIRAAEAWCHLQLSDSRISGEWFDVSTERAIEVAKESIKFHGL